MNLKPSLLPISSLKHETCRSLKGIFADIDDTITTDGYLTPEAYTAMEKLQKSGLLMIPVTGRPAGWCDHIARMWPVDGIIGENGAFYFHYDKKLKKFTKRLMTIPKNQEDQRARLCKVADRIFREIPGTAFASDQKYRLADIAIDISEDVKPIVNTGIKGIVTIMEEEGLNAKVSSIHVNGWLGNYDKLTMTKIMMSECFKLDLEANSDRFLFIGDSPNDEPMFKFFQNSVGVANISSFFDVFETMPKYLTKEAFGLGFSEMASAVITGRS